MALTGKLRGLAPTLFLAAATLYAAGPSVAPIGQVQAQPGGDRLVGPAALAAIVGNTLVGSIRDRGETVIFLDRDGTTKVAQAGKTSALKWSFTGEKLCFVGGRADGQPECAFLEVIAKSATLVDGGEMLGKLEILPGNARNL
jgi:hypothetical protein